MAKKYIDVERLRAELEKKSYEEQGFRSEDSKYGYRSCARDLLAFIDYLQQEQDLAEKIYEATLVAKRLADRNSFYNSLPESIRHKYTDKAWDEILETFCSLQQEQPEVDLEKEIEWEWVHREKQEVDLIECAEMDKEEFVRFARHFYELGQKDAANKYDEVEYNRQRADEKMSDKTLDEAAERYQEDIKAHFLRTLEHPTAGECFRAGAEWMAKQGYSYEDKVYLLDGGDTCESYPGLDGEGEKQCIDKAVKDGYLKVGDKVIVQIRKKKEDEK